MALRLLIDENLDPGTAQLLRNRGFDATHVEAELGKGTHDRDIAAYARNHVLVVVTNDRDFCRPELNRVIHVVMVADDAARASTVSDAIEELSGYVSDQSDLKNVTWI